VSEPQPLRPGDRVMVVEGGEIRRGIVRYRSATLDYYYVVDLPDEHVEAKFSNTTATLALQQFRRTTIDSRDENKTWVRGWVDEEEAKAIFVAEALV
jgi:hypothetical protein